MKRKKYKWEIHSYSKEIIALYRSLSCKELSNNKYRRFWMRFRYALSQTSLLLTRNV